MNKLFYYRESKNPKDLEDINPQLDTKNLALVCCFASVQAVLSMVSLFPVIGSVGKFITMATVMAPLIGLILGPYLGTAAVSIGGFIGWTITQAGPFSFLSFVPSANGALFSGLLYNRKRAASIVLYLALFLALAFYPWIGPAWLYPYYLWFQLVGLIVLASPLSSRAADSLHKHSNFFELSFSVGIISFLAVLFGQVVGTVMFEIMYWPTVYPQMEAWKIVVWQPTTLVYPIERTLITLITTVIGAPLIKALRANGFEIGEVKKNATLQSKNQTN